MNKELRESQVLGVTAQDRDELNDENPIIFAEMGTNRYNVWSWFFPEEDGVNVTVDLDLREYEIKYFDRDGKEEVLEPGSVLYEWAKDLYDRD